MDSRALDPAKVPTLPCIIIPGLHISYLQELPNSELVTQQMTSDKTDLHFNLCYDIFQNQSYCVILSKIKF